MRSKAILEDYDNKASIVFEEIFVRLQGLALRIEAVSA